MPESKNKEGLIAIGVAICIFLLGLYIGLQKPPIQAHLSNQKIIDSLVLQTKIDSIKKVQLVSDLKKSDSTWKATIDSLHNKFNTDEKNKRLRSISVLSDSASLEFFSSWVSEIDSLAR